MFFWSMILFLFAMISVTLLIIYAMETKFEKNRFWGGLLIAIGFICLIISNIFMYHSGRGKVVKDSGLKEMEEDGIYETMNSTEVEGRWLSVIRSTDGEIALFELDHPTPKFFRKTGNPDSPYEPFPEKVEKMVVPILQPHIIFVPVNK